MKRVQCATFLDLQAKSVGVEASLTKGLPSFSIVGMASQSISESKERVKSALLNNGFHFPPKRVTINLSPSDCKKEGSHFDLAVALLISLHDKTLDFGEYYVFGELGLDGSVKANAILFAIILSLANQGGIKKALVPSEALAQLSKIPDVEFIGIAHLREAIDFFTQGVQKIATQHTDIDAKRLRIARRAYYYQNDYPEDFFAVKGQEVAKRAALIAAAGMHNLLLEGSPGCGKSMIAKRLRSILPPLSLSELLDIAKLDVLDAKEPTFQALRPFRSPHHSSTKASIFGGGSGGAKIGEVGLAHNGILFFDELPHFSKSVLEALREPLEDRKIAISRVNTKVEYKTDFLFIAAMNPCPCGNLLHTHKECRCSELEIKRYKNRLSEPLLERIDIYVQMQNTGANDKPSVSSQELHKRVIEAFIRQKERGQEKLNGRLSDEEVATFCILGDDENAILERAIDSYALSQRAIGKVKRLARTVADIEASERIEKAHLLEALSYRRR